MEQAVFVDESTHTSTVTSSNVNLSKTPPCPHDFLREKMRTLGTGLMYLILSFIFHDVQDKKNCDAGIALYSSAKAYDIDQLPQPMPSLLYINKVNKTGICGIILCYLSLLSLIIEALHILGESWLPQCLSTLLQQCQVTTSFHYCDEHNISIKIVIMF